MKKDFTMRIASEDDLPDMQTILKNSSRDWSVAALSSCFNKEYDLWVICFEEFLLGFAVVKKIVNHWEILQIVIDKEYQQQGLATRLLQFIIIEARKKQIKKIQLEVRQSNIVAIRLYQKFRFIEVGSRKKYYSDGEDAVLMDLVL